MRKLALLALFAAAAVGAQEQTGGRISGTVVDPTGRPVAGADVFVITQTHRARTDSAGRYVIDGLDGGNYRVRARRIGFMPNEMTTDLTKTGRVTLNFELKVRPAILDSVVIRADGRCPDASFVGFNCRKHGGKGVYFTEDDLLDRGAIELGDVFRNVDGFRIEMVPTPYGAKPRPLATRGGSCLNALVNGRPIALTNQLPRYAYELVAVEIYARANDVPSEYERYVWQRSTRQSSTFSREGASSRCALVVYWTTYS